MNITSREYKLLMRHELFTLPTEGIPSFQKSLEQAFKNKNGIVFIPADSLESEDPISILFLDTASFSLHGNFLILRQRQKKNKLEYTLKCRSEDRYFAEKTLVADGIAVESKFKQKLEEDVAIPFIGRYSNSCTYTPDKPQPKTLGELAELFPVVEQLALGAATEPLTQVNQVTVKETVWGLGELVFGTLSASLALIVWARQGGQETPVVAELSFRIKEKEEIGQEKKLLDALFTRELALSTRDAYATLQKLSQALPGGTTKTEYIYGKTSHD